MKRTIKLRESELKRLVAESVKGAINELDWKTYASAAKKRAEQGASDYDITVQYLIDSFSLIRQDWRTGET